MNIKKLKFALKVAGAFALIVLWVFGMGFSMLLGQYLMSSESYSVHFLSGLVYLGISVAVGAYFLADEK